MKKSLLLAITIFTCSFLFAQNELLVHKSDKGLYLDHIVVAKESFYSIGRLFNLPPKEIAGFNGLDMNQGLAIGQALKIPLGKSNFTQAKDNGRAVFYVVGASEGLYRVSVKNNNVLMANLRKWNHLSNDRIAEGQKLVVGFLVSPEAAQIIAVAPPEEKKETVSEPVPNKTADANTQTPVKKEDAVVVTEEKKIPPPVSKPANTPTPPQIAVTDKNGGYFKSQFDLQIKTQPVKKDETASAGIFKTASGWQDAKYYALMDGLEPGTIIRVINPSNNKTIYAKVLGAMSGIRQNQGYDVRISNSAASALEVTDTEKFIVRVNY